MQNQIDGMKGAEEVVGGKQIDQKFYILILMNILLWMTVIFI